jgi:hypothetical protein
MDMGIGGERGVDHPRGRHCDSRDEQACGGHGRENTTVERSDVI